MLSTHPLHQEFSLSNAHSQSHAYCNGENSDGGKLQKATSQERAHRLQLLSIAVQHACMISPFSLTGRQYCYAPAASGIFLAKLMRNHIVTTKVRTLSCALTDTRYKSRRRLAFPSKQQLNHSAVTRSPPRLHAYPDSTKKHTIRNARSQFSKGRQKLSGGAPD